MSHGGIEERLRARIAAARDRRLREIEAWEKSEAESAKRQAAAGLEARLTERRRERERELELARERLSAAAEEERRTRMWQFEREKIDDILAAIRARLRKRPLDEKRLRRWLSGARARLDGQGDLVLQVRKDWLPHLRGITGVELRASEMLGGAILTAGKSGLQVDASWDRRLRDLLPALRLRWRKGVGADHQD